MNIISGDNLKLLQDLAAAGQKFDLVEVDGPYMAGLEPGWDDLTPDEFMIHYQQRLALVRQVLQPWGAVFVFGFPDGLYSVAAWLKQTRTLHLRRWIHWYKHLTQNRGRKIETILFLLRDDPQVDEVQRFGRYLKEQRESRGWTLGRVQTEAKTLGYTGATWWHRGGNLYFETGAGGPPSGEDLRVLAQVFGFDPNEWAHVTSGSYPGLTDLDVISVNDERGIERAVELNQAGLRSKPIQLYSQLFAPVKPQSGSPRALILYGGSGNAGIAAEALGYDVIIAELDPERVKLIERRAANLVPKWKQRLTPRQPKLPIEQQAGLWIGA